MKSFEKAPLRMVFQGGKLVKIDGMRPEQMDGDKLIALLRQTAEALNEINDIVYDNPTLSREDYFKIRFLATRAAKEQGDELS